jgi:hypothetical protein
LESFHFVHSSVKIFRLGNLPFGPVSLFCSLCSKKKSAGPKRTVMGNQSPPIWWIDFGAGKKAPKGLKLQK